MQLDNFYINIIQITLLDAITIGAAAGMLATTIFGLKLKRQESNTIQWLIGGTIASIIGTVFGYCIMNAIGFLTAWAGSPIHGLAGADLIEWTDTITANFAPYQMHAAGFALFGALLGIGWGYGIGGRPDDTSKLGNLIATLGAIAIIAGLLLTLMPSIISLSDTLAFLYLVMFNGLVVLCYGIIYLGIRWGYDTPRTLIAIALSELLLLYINIPYAYPLGFPTFLAILLAVSFPLICRRAFYLHIRGPVDPSLESESSEEEEMLV
ncbi:MAG: hypothetical protein RTV72_03405 [Candidatus Thorarchaeota archaeon]